MSEVEIKGRRLKKSWNRLLICTSNNIAANNLAFRIQARASNNLLIKNCMIIEMHNVEIEAQVMVHNTNK